MQDVHAIEVRLSHLRAAQKHAHPDGQDGNASARLGVCIIGQVSRLLLRSKIDNFFLANRDRFIVDVVFVLGDAAEARYVNAETVPMINGAPVSVSWNRSSIKNEVKGSVNGAIVVDIHPQLAEPLLHERYSTHLDKSAKILNITRRTEVQDDRARAHVRQWYALLKCYSHFLTMEQRNAAPYSAFVKLRDDSVVLSNLRVNLRSVHKKVVTQECASWGGVNDKAAMLGATEGFTYFAKPLLTWYFDYNQVATVTNPEGYLDAILRNTTVTTVRADAFPILTGRNGISGSVCFPLDVAKIGWDENLGDAACVPPSCPLRAYVYCNRCSDDDDSTSKLLRICTEEFAVSGWRTSAC